MDTSPKKVEKASEPLTNKPGCEAESSKSSEHLLTRSEVASLIGISTSEFKRREALGTYVATFINEKGWHYFSMEYVTSLPGYGDNPREKHGRQSASEKAAKYKADFDKNSPAAPQARPMRPSSFYEPELAAKIFQALNEGMSSREIVIKLLIHPDIMNAVYETWLQLGTAEGSGIVIPPSIMKKINDLGETSLPGSFPITSAEQLLENLREASQGTHICPMCNKKPSRICMTCAEPDPGFAGVPLAPVKPKATLGRPRKTG